MQLADAIHSSRQYDSVKQERISNLKIQLWRTSPDQLKTVHDIYTSLYEENKVFNYDSAYWYAAALLNHSRNSKDRDGILDAKLKMSFILLSGGLYKETYDSLFSIKVADLPQNKKLEYYSLAGRYYFDIAAYASDNYHSVDYDIIGCRFIDSALNYASPGSFEYDYYQGLRSYKKGDPEGAKKFFLKLLSRKDLSFHQQAINTSTLSAIYMQRNQTDSTVDLLIMAAIADIKSSTKETVAIFHLADWLYKTRQLKYAAICIETAIANAQFYGARQRKVQASAILPLIEGERINAIESEKALLFKYSILVTFLVLMLVVLTYLVFRQVRKLKLAQQALTQAHHQQQIANDQLRLVNSKLEATNLELKLLNTKLEEANKIKEEYIGYFFHSDSEFYARMDKIKATIEKKLFEKQYNDIAFVINKINSRREREELVKSFDKLFIKLFPRFVDEVNALLRPDEQIILKEGELLNTDLRIFALIRMGITDTEKVAAILGYSVKTIYAYKTRIKHKSDIQNDEFEECIMNIKAF